MHLSEWEWVSCVKMSAWIKSQLFIAIGEIYDVGIQSDKSPILSLSLAPIASIFTKVIIITYVFEPVPALN